MKKTIVLFCLLLLILSIPQAISQQQRVNLTEYTFQGTAIIRGPPLQLNAPQITIEFAGNLSDASGPFYKPPESNGIKLTGDYASGYYVNNSRQHEEYIHIIATISHLYPLLDIRLHMYDATSNTWDDTTPLTQTSTDTYEATYFVNPDNVNHKYTFHITATDTKGKTGITHWRKNDYTNTGHTTTRYVYLNCIPQDPSYLNMDTAFYIHPHYITHLPSSRFSHDKLQYDGATGTSFDFALFNLTRPTYDHTDHAIMCGSNIWVWFEAPLCWDEKINVTNIYYHLWSWSGELGECTGDISFTYGWTPSNNDVPIGVQNDNFYIPYNKTNHLVTDMDIEGNGQGLYHLNTFKLEPSNWNGGKPTTDNSIYSTCIYGNNEGKKQGISRINLTSNKTCNSFILFNIPDAETLNTTDWSEYDGTIGDRDGDGLSDYEELYTYGTNPYEEDTDQDGYTDNNEVTHNTNPNDHRSHIGKKTIQPIFLTNIQNKIQILLSWLLSLFI